MKNQTSGRYITTSVAGESVRAFVPNALPPKLKKPVIDNLAEPLRAAENALAQMNLAGEMIPSLDWFIYAFVRKEALLSSEIEGTQATLIDVLAWEQAEQHGESNLADIEEVTNYVAAINFAFKQINSPKGTPISIRLLNDCHKILMRGVRGAAKQPGELRTSQNWIGGSHPGTAVFVPAPPEMVVELLSDLERYIYVNDKSHIHPLLRVALVHAQFETIHPYLDGNGRLGRMLIALLLYHWELLKAPLLYLSLYLKSHQAEYYQRLNANRAQRDWQSWLNFFLVGVAEIAEDATKTASALYSRVNQDRKLLLNSTGTTVTSIQLFELLPLHPVISMPVVTELLGTTKPTAGKAINTLVSTRILTEIGTRKRDRLYRYENYLRILD